MRTGSFVGTVALRLEVFSGSAFALRGLPRGDGFLVGAEVSSSRALSVIAAELCGVNRIDALVDGGDDRALEVTETSLDESAVLRLAEVDLVGSTFVELGFVEVGLTLRGD